MIVLHVTSLFNPPSISTKKHGSEKYLRERGLMHIRALKFLIERNIAAGLPGCTLFSLAKSKRIAQFAWNFRKVKPKLVRWHEC